MSTLVTLSDFRDEDFPWVSEVKTTVIQTYDPRESALALCQQRIRKKKKGEIDAFWILKENTDEASTPN